MLPSHLRRVEAESIHIIREAVAQAEQPVMLYSIGKDSAVTAAPGDARRSTRPGRRSRCCTSTRRGSSARCTPSATTTARSLGLDLIVHINPEGLANGINPFTHGSAVHTDVMKTEALKQALDEHGFDAAFGGARRDEEKSRAKERVFSLPQRRSTRWDPKHQRPELWRLYNARTQPGRVACASSRSRTGPSSTSGNTSSSRRIPIVPLYFAAERPVVERDGTLIMVDDERMPLEPGERPVRRKVRFRTLGCYPLTGAIESDADTLPAIIAEMLGADDVRAPGPPDRPRQQRARWRRRSRRATSEMASQLLNAPRTAARPDHLCDPSDATIRKRLLRFITCGSVDDGKSTLIGRLLYESKQLFERPAARRWRRDSRKFGTRRRRARLRAALDGLAAEREQGITIDVAYRYFSTEPAQVHRRRRAGPRAVHAQHGDRRLDRRLRGHPGRRPQGRAHADAPPHLPRRRCSASATSCWRSTRWTSSATRRERFRAIEREYRDFATQVGLEDDHAASRCRRVHGDNVVHRSERTPWYSGPTLLEHLERREARAGADAGRAVPHAGAVGEPAGLGLPRLRRTDRRRRRPRPGDADRRRALRPPDHGRRASSPSTATCRRPSPGQP